MAKTKEELNELKNEYKSLANKLQELTEDELIQVTGGIANPDHIMIQVGQFAPTEIQIDETLGNKAVPVAEAMMINIAK